MEIIRTRDAMQQAVAAFKKEGKTIGFVPTMGALHEGHLTLMRLAQQENDIAVCSIFVNPTQFNNPTDLERYPRNPEKDAEAVSGIVDIAFIPSVEEMYPKQPTETYDFGDIEKVMEGPSRPGHFQGVGMVVSRLFELVQPDRAYFGKKDYQQVAIIRRLVELKKYPIEIVPVEIVRADDGLALSSRNALLHPDKRAKAPFIYRTLKQAKEMATGHTLQEVEQWIKERIGSDSDFELEYIQIADAETLQPIGSFADAAHVVACITVWLDGVRLIDNIEFK
ncbi:MAG: pantoate--beta-alanine ligase [Bacteroidales bacterium]|nr:pantoate--beta-alanine ligase [Bacteroidales bacterium]